MLILRYNLGMTPEIKLLLTVLFAVVIFLAMLIRGCQCGTCREERLVRKRMRKSPRAKLAKAFR